MKKILTKKGFTLIELIVVIAILAILAAILIPSITNYITAANDAKNQSDTRSEYSRLMLSFATTDGAPLDSNGAALSSGGNYKLGDDLNCTATFDDDNILTFSCHSDKKQWTLDDNFEPTAYTAPTGS